MRPWLLKQVMVVSSVSHMLKFSNFYIL